MRARMPHIGFLLADNSRLARWAFDQQVRSAKLEGALEGDERIQWWEEQKKFIIQDEPDEPGEAGEQQTQSDA